MIGMKMSSGASTVYLRFAATDPYWSARDNRTMVAIWDDDKSCSQDEYNGMYHWGGSAVHAFDGKTLKASYFQSFTDDPFETDS